MKFNDYVVSVNDYVHNEIRLIAVKASNIKHAIVKALVKLHNEFYEDNIEELPIDGDLLYEKFINIKGEYENIEDFINTFRLTYSEFTEYKINTILENGKEVIIENID